MQNAIMGMRTLNITQGNFTNYTHKGINANDLAGEDTGQDVWRAKNRWKCVNVLPYSTTGFANTCLFSPCDINGNLCKVMTPSGEKELTIALTHDNTIRVVKGQIYEGDSFIYKEGTAGNATGNHVHAEACFKFVTNKVKLTGTQYYNGSTWVLPDAVPLHEALFLLEGYNYTPINTNNYDWKWVKTIELESDIIDTNKDVIKYTIQYKGLTINIGKLPKKDKTIIGSVDGNKYGTNYDKTIAEGFSDKNLLKEGYKEAFATNGSTFYTYEGATYAEGIEISRGIINQEYNLSTVSKFANCMALGFTKEGKIIFDLQKNIQNMNNIYGAVTFVFGIIKDGIKNTAGSEDNRGGAFTTKSGRSIFAEDKDNYYSIAFYGVTGQSGLTGNELYDLCVTISPEMLNAGCFDGGGSVWQRINDEYTITTTRLVKNSVMLFYKNNNQENNQNPDQNLEDTIKELQNEVNKLNSTIEILNKELENIKMENQKLNNKLQEITKIIQE